MKICIAQRKGGVGKTVSSRELSVTLHSMGKKVLVVDCDPQHNLTNHLNVAPASTLTDILMGRADAAEAIVTSAYGPDVIAADTYLAMVEAGMATMPDNKTILAENLEAVVGDYDFVFFDSPANLGLLTANAVYAADVILAPVTGDGLDSVGGVLMLQKSLEQETRENKPMLLIKTRWQPKRKLSREIDAAIEQLGLKVVGTVPERAIVREGASTGPLAFNLPDSEPALAYRRIAETLVESEVGAWLSLAQ